VMTQPSMRFGRGPDRRKESRPAADERRGGERREAAIRWITLFRDADPREVEETLGGLDVLALPAGTPILRRGEANGDVFILLSGKVIVQMGDDPSPETAIEIGAGECIGELSAIDGQPVTALVIAATGVRLLKLDRDTFWNRVMLMRGVGANLMRTLSERMRRSNEKALASQRQGLELQHLRKELEVARQLQASMLPLQRPIFPGRADIEVCGFMEPTSRVGGDLFDAFFVDDRTLFVCVGDVSGHGIAAALFMVRVIGLLRVLAMESASPEKILETLNDRLCIGNDANLFVTLFCGFLDVPSGRLVYSNGGHCAPMVCEAQGAAMLPLPKGALVGAASGRHYSALERILEPGETLLCYTDGVTEAEDKSGVPFAEQGCLEILGKGVATPLPALLDSLYEKVVGHCGSRLLADDCTMLAVRRPLPRPAAAEIPLPASTTTLVA